MQPLFEAPLEEPGNIIRYTRLLLRNGLSYFYGDDIIKTDYCYKGNYLIFELFFSRVNCFQRIAYQLLALGVGRRELHPGDLPVRSVALEDTRFFIQRAS